MSQGSLSSGPNRFTLDDDSDDQSFYDDTTGTIPQKVSESTTPSTPMRSSSGFLDSYEHEDDMSFQDEIHLQKVSGTVHCSKDGTGVRGVNVYLVDTGQTGSTMTVETDTNGKFTFSNVESGTYTIRVKEIDARTNASNITRPMSSKVVTVQDGIDLDSVILFKYGSSVGNKNKNASPSLYNTDNNITCDDEHVSMTEGGWRSQSKTMQETIAELNKKDRTLSESSKIHKGNKTMCMRGLSIGTEDSWDDLKNDDDMSLHDEEMDVIFEKYCGEGPVHHDQDKERPNVTNVAKSSMCMRGLSLGPEPSSWEIEDTTGFLNNDDNDDDMSFHDETNLQQVSGTVHCSKDGTGFREANVHLVDAGHAGISTVTVKTDANGNFTFSNVQSGTYIIRVQPLPNTSNVSRPMLLTKVVTVQDGINVDRVMFESLQSHESSSLIDDIDDDDSSKLSRSHASHDEDKAGDEVEERRGASMYSLHVAVISLAVVVLLKARKS